MKVSVIIPSLYRKTEKYLELCVKSLRDSGIDWDIIVVTNGGPKPFLLTEKIPGITLHVHTEQQGQCNAVNIGAQFVAPDTDYIMVSNDDMYYAPSWNRYLRFDDLVFSPNLIEPIDNSGSAPPFLKMDGGLNLEAFMKETVDSYVDSILEAEPSETVMPNGEVGQKTPVLEEDGFNLPFFIRKDVWQTIGGYDKAYDPWGSNSDTDLQTLIEIAGIKPKRLRDVVVYHFGQKSGTFEAPNQEAWWRNFNYYTDKFGFNRDMEPKADTWYCKNMIHHDKLIFKPPWMNKYGKVSES